MNYRKLRHVLPSRAALFLGLYLAFEPTAGEAIQYVFNTEKPVAAAYASPVKQNNKMWNKSTKKSKKPKPIDILGGSRASMDKQNRIADKYNLTRIEDDAMMRRFIKGGYLVRLPVSSKNYSVTASRPYARPYTKLFVERLSQQYRANFGRRLKVTSAVRPKKYNHKLGRTNSNVSLRSVHPTGAVVDISHRYMNRKEKRWVDGVLRSLESKGYIEATREWRQPVYHVMVFPSYSGYVRQISR